MASYKVFALFALLALCVVGASATSFLQYTPLAMLKQQRCMALMMQGIMSPECQQFSTMFPVIHQMQQQCCMALMMQGIMSPECQQLGAMYPITHQMQQYYIPPVMQGMMAPRCQCGSMCQVPIVNSPLAYSQQCVAGCSC
ncbi:hypothetical protein PVAP13_9KG123400 [Panicum virgatum]|uniref:Bifunctional inhibitor/plant lipid transfer protein/seed storage helical domain-containing protein n=1 Tax=Panicum virgatum TaxID=38727 RepID=A0A8T0NFW4_PANVG|nr:hypothetical protein PVAP13_9KG123400 [Panicum virgatum]